MGILRGVARITQVRHQVPRINICAVCIICLYPLKLPMPDLHCGRSHPSSGKVVRQLSEKVEKASGPGRQSAAFQNRTEKATHGLKTDHSVQEEEQSWGPIM